MTPGDADRRARDLGVLALALLALIWGYNWVVMKVGLDYVRPLPFAALRTSLGVLPPLIARARFAPDRDEMGPRRSDEEDPRSDDE